MNYKFGFVIKETNDYLRKIDLINMNFIKDDLIQELNYDSSGVVYIEEDVNMPKSDKLIQLLKDNGIAISDYISIVKWKDFPKV